jgi:hypothetical protein
MAAFHLRGVVAGAAMLVLVCSAQAQTTLRYKFTKNEKIGYLIEQKLSLKVDKDGKESEMAMDQTIDVSWDVKDVEKSGKAKITYKFERFRLSMNGPKGKIEYDSKDGKMVNDPFNQEAVFKALNGLEFNLSMDPQGEISEVTIPEKFLEAMKTAAASAPGVGEMFTPDSLKKMLIQAGLVLPKEAVNKGKSWTQKIASKLPFGEMKTEYGYTYEGPMAKGELKLEQIALRSSVTLDSDPSVPVALKVKESSGKGTAIFDNEAGRLREVTMSQQMIMEAMGATMRATTVISVKIKD